MKFNPFLTLLQCNFHIRSVYYLESHSCCNPSPMHTLGVHSQSWHKRGCSSNTRSVLSKQLSSDQVSSMGAALWEKQWLLVVKLQQMLRPLSSEKAEGRAGRADSLALLLQEAQQWPVLSWHGNIVLSPSKSGCHHLRLSGYNWGCCIFAIVFPARATKPGHAGGFLSCRSPHCHVGNRFGENSQQIRVRP